MNALFRIALVVAASGLPLVQNAIGAETYVVE